jgi:hypothetical protein
MTFGFYLPLHILPLDQQIEANTDVAQRLTCGE